MRAAQTDGRGSCAAPADPEAGLAPASQRHAHQPGCTTGLCRPVSGPARCGQQPEGSGSVVSTKCGRSAAVGGRRGSFLPLPRKHRVDTQDRGAGRSHDADGDLVGQSGAGARGSHVSWERSWRGSGLQLGSARGGGGRAGASARPEHQVGGAGQVQSRGLSAWWGSSEGPRVYATS